MTFQRQPNGKTKIWLDFGEPIHLLDSEMDEIKEHMLEDEITDCENEGENRLDELKDAISELMDDVEKAFDEANDDDFNKVVSKINALL